MANDDFETLLSKWKQAKADRDAAFKMALESDGRRRDFWLERLQTRIDDADHAAEKIIIALSI